MSEIPERIEREMFEIRNRMAPDVTDLRAHVEPKAIAEQVKSTLRQRLRAALNQLKDRFDRARRETLDSARRQFRLAREASKKRNPAPFTDAVKSDPRPMILLAVALALTLFMARKIGNKS